MSVAHRVLCMFGRHTRGPRDRVWNDGMYFRSTCRGCHAPLLRDDDGWRTLHPHEVKRER